MLLLAMRMGTSSLGLFVPRFPRPIPAAYYYMWSRCRKYTVARCSPYPGLLYVLCTLAGF